MTVRAECTYVCTGLKLGVMNAVAGATVHVYERGTTTPVVQSMWTLITGGTAQVNPLTANSVGAVQFWLDTSQYVTITWTAAGFVGVTEDVPVGDPTGSALPAGVITSLQVDGSIEITAHKNVASGYPGLDASTAPKITATQQHGSRLRRTFDSFCTSNGGSGKTTATPTPTLATQTAAWTAARVWADANGGGIVEFEAGVYAHLPQLELGMFGSIQGAGPLTTVIQPDSTLATHFVINHVGNGTVGNPSARGVMVRDIGIDCTSMGANWGVQQYDAIHIDRGSTADGNSAEEVARIFNCYIDQAAGSGIYLTGRGTNIVAQCAVFNSGFYGIVPSTDSEIANCTTGFTRKYGFYFQTGPCRVTGCKAFAAGNGTDGTTGAGYFFTSGVAGSIDLTSCEAQDCNGPGFESQAQGLAFVACHADSNSVGTVVNGTKSYPGFQLTGASYTRLIGCQATERNLNGANQKWAVGVTTSSNSRIDCTFYAKDEGHGVAAISTPFKTLDTASVGIDCNINALKSYQSVVFGTTITPDFYAGGILEVGVLTAGVTIAAPTNGSYPVGTHARIILKQDGTGGRTITWNATYVNTPTTNAAVSGYTIGRFVWNGTNWVGV